MARVAERRDCSTLRFTRTFARVGAELSVWRCSWGWKVQLGDRAARSASLVTALETVVGKLTDADLRLIVDALEADVATARAAETAATAAA